MKKPKRSHGRKDSVSIDHISGLPDDVLAHILSFLSTKDAVQTCVLSKRWRRTWASVPVLNFNIDDFWSDNAGVNDDEKRKECELKFEQFMNGVLENRSPLHLNTFQYEYNIDENYSEASMQWLDQVALLMPRIINVFIYRENVLDVPDLVFSCAWLEKLDLSLYTDDMTIIRPKSVNLPSLKYLEMRCVDLDDDFAEKLFRGSPALESLYLVSCDLWFSNISSKVLRTLVLEGCRQLNQMQICCPSLVSLVIETSHQMGSISLKNTTSLVNVDIKLDRPDDFLFDGDLNLLGGLSNVSTLKLDLWCAEFKEKLEKNILNCRSFNNLKSLDIGRWNMSKNNNLVDYFLRCSPNLQNLTLNLVEPLEDDIEEPIQKESGKVSFQREHLETVRLLKWEYCMIIKWENNDMLLHRVIKNLRARIKTLGKIIIG